jgi:hypothetical protein
MGCRYIPTVLGSSGHKGATTGTTQGKERKRLLEFFFSNQHK